jgi:RNA polymerase sigma factor (sigma-70 family)
MEVLTTRPTRAAARTAEGLEFEEFFRAEFPEIVRALFLLVPDRQEAEELAQEAMARAYERWDRVRVMASPTGYVYRTAVNLNRRRLRHLAVRARRSIVLGARTEAVPPPETAPELAEAIASLSAGQREAFLLVEWVGMSSEEAGRILRIAPASVRSRVHRAKDALRDRLRHKEERDG